MKSASGTHWGIVGGGMLGLTLAYRLLKQGDRVTILEASDRAGGLADAWALGDVTWDRHYHVILTVDQALITMLSELGLEDEITWAKTGTDLFDGTRFHPLNGGIDFLRLPMLSLVDKVRLAATILYASRIENGSRLADTDLEEWLVKLSGRRVFDTIWRPLLRTKLGDTYKQASAKFIQSVIRRFYSARSQGVASDRFGAVKGGYATILERLVAELEAAGAEFHTNAPVSAIGCDAGGMTAVSKGKTYSFDKVIVTAPPPHAARMCKDLEPGEKARLAGTRYQGVICASALLTKPLRGGYMTYITGGDCPLTTVIDMSSVAGKQAFGGRTLAYLPMYLPSDDPLFEASDEDLKALILGGLNQLYPDISAGDIAAFRISRAPHVFPVPVRGYASMAPGIVTSVPGLYTVNSANILDATFSVNETIELADRALAQILGDTRAMPREALPRAAE
ncbi:MAG: FAD-dependent oxidoreductase [Rhodobiaceae bacterium]|nr:FAD-dependent oxidoreductase [Rhodobiaceae bacterium]MCC0050120.1 FAD-dependent oxidoreductase [Rhodobiaceae bacterium]